MLKRYLVMLQHDMTYLAVNLLKKEKKKWHHRLMERLELIQVPNTTFSHLSFNSRSEVVFRNSNLRWSNILSMANILSFGRGLVILPIESNISIKFI